MQVILDPFCTFRAGGSFLEVDDLFSLLFERSASLNLSCLRAPYLRWPLAPTERCFDAETHCSGAAVPG